MNEIWARAFQRAMQAELLQQLNDMQQPQASPAEFKGGSYDFVNEPQHADALEFSPLLGTKENCAAIAEVQLL